MSVYPTILKTKLLSLIHEMAKSSGSFVKNPKKDFTRNRKLPFDAVMQLILSMGGQSIYKELLESSGYSLDTPTTSAFIQQRDKILPYAFEFLFREFTKTFSQLKEYRGYRLLAIDGSSVPIASCAHDDGTYVRNHGEKLGYYAMHLNAMYDLCNRIYIDAFVQPEKCANEPKALVDMVDRTNIAGKAIILADRMYEGYNVFAHIENKNWNYLIRVRDIGRRTGIVLGLPLPEDGEFDIPIQRVLTRHQTNEVKAHPEIYRFIPKTSNFDYLTSEKARHTNETYQMAFRVVRFKISDDFYETVITNLDACNFPPMELKKLYSMRWGIETSFRELKYSVGLSFFHARKREFIVQEIFARLIVYNFSEMIISNVIILQENKYLTYQVNFTVAIYICRHFLRVQRTEHPPDVEALIQKNILPVRPGRQAKRNLRYKSTISFLYRVA